MEYLSALLSRTIVPLRLKKMRKEVKGKEDRQKTKISNEKMKTCEMHRGWAAKPYPVSLSHHIRTLELTLAPGTCNTITVELDVLVPFRYPQNVSSIFKLCLHYFYNKHITLWSTSGSLICSLSEWEFILGDIVMEKKWEEKNGHRENPIRRAGCFVSQINLVSAHVTWAHGNSTYLCMEEKVFTRARWLGTVFVTLYVMDFKVLTNL